MPRKKRRVPPGPQVPAPAPVQQHECGECETWWPITQEICGNCGVKVQCLEPDFDAGPVGDQPPADADDQPPTPAQPTSTPTGAPSNPTPQHLSNVPTLPSIPAEPPGLLPPPFPVRGGEGGVLGRQVRTAGLPVRVPEVPSMPGQPGDTALGQPRGGMPSGYVVKRGRGGPLALPQTTAPPPDDKLPPAAFNPPPAMVPPPARAGRGSALGLIPPQPAGGRGKSMPVNPPGYAAPFAPAGGEDPVPMDIDGEPPRKRLREAEGATATSLNDALADLIGAPADPFQPQETPLETVPSTQPAVEFPSAPEPAGDGDDELYMPVPVGGRSHDAAAQGAGVASPDYTPTSVVPNAGRGRGRGKGGGGRPPFGKGQADAAPNVKYTKQKIVSRVWQIYVHGAPKPIDFQEAKRMFGKQVKVVIPGARSGSAYVDFDEAADVARCMRLSNLPRGVVVERSWRSTESALVGFSLEGSSPHPDHQTLTRLVGCEHVDFHVNVLQYKSAADAVYACAAYNGMKCPAPFAHCTLVLWAYDKLIPP
ncbi:hypothetical protein DIPPA_23654 [Diplonema papillatum]|nr:hypothetical protein DIPPA_23654 [Diplonema papillatum]